MNWLLLQLDVKTHVHFLLDSVAQILYVRGIGITPVDESQRVPRGDTGVAELKTFREACLFE